MSQKVSCDHKVIPGVPLRRYNTGPEKHNDCVNFRVWAPDVQTLHLAVKSEAEEGQFCTHEMSKNESGYHSLCLASLKSLSHYGFSFPDDERIYPDPSSRLQPDGPHGLSQIDDSTFSWTDSDWKGPDLNFQILYELHVGTFTKEGTFSAAQAQLLELKNLGITTIELMPVAEFDGRFGWGYDGVNLFAPYHTYGAPDQLKSFINEAHKLGLAVILDVVYNHFGAGGNYIHKFSHSYFTEKHANEWGEALNFDGDASSFVREFFVDNALYWISEFHFDGLRLDATQQIYDDSQTHIIKEIIDTIRGAAKDRQLLIVGENEPQEVRLIKDFGVDALWNDDFHHSARVALTGKREGYYADYRGSSQELLSTVRKGFLYQGQLSYCRSKGHGTLVDHLSPNCFITFIENHDQVANSGRGQRLCSLVHPGSYKALLLLLLMGPNSPMLFQGQEFCSSAPFGYFADHEKDLAKLVYEGRKDSLRKFRSLNNEEMLSSIQHPEDPEFFSACKLDLSERESHSQGYAFVKQLIQLRKSYQLYKSPNMVVDGATFNSKAFCIRLSGDEQLLLIINLGADLLLQPAPEPLLVPPLNQRWKSIVSSENPAFGGLGSPDVFTANDIYIPAHCGMVFESTNLR